MTIMGELNVPGHARDGRLARFIRPNLLNFFVELLIDKDKKRIAMDWEDEIITGTALTRDGEIVHPF